LDVVDLWEAVSGSNPWPAESEWQKANDANHSMLRGCPRVSLKIMRGLAFS